MKKKIGIILAIMTLLFVAVIGYGYAVASSYTGYDSEKIKTQASRLKVFESLGGISYLCSFDNALEQPFDASVLPADLQTDLLSAPVTSRTIIESIHKEAKDVRSSLPSVIPFISRIPPIKQKADLVTADANNLDAIIKATESNQELQYCEDIDFALGSLIGYWTLSDETIPVFSGMLDMYKEDINRFGIQITDATVPQSLTNEHELVKSFANKAAISINNSSSDRKLLAETVTGDKSQMQVFLDSIAIKTADKRKSIDSALSLIK